MIDLWFVLWVGNKCFSDNSMNLLTIMFAISEQLYLTTSSLVDCVLL